MSDIRNDRNHVLAVDSLEKMLVNIVNLPDEEFPVTRDTQPEQEWNLSKYREMRLTGSFPATKVYNPTRRPRHITQTYWPQLWEEIPDSNTDGETRGREVILRMQRYLRAFWEAKAPRDREWHIFRAREYFERLRILPGLQGYGETVRDSVAQALLDEPPAVNPIERALYRLQERAKKASLAPRICPADDCPQRYFLAEKKGQKFCSQVCSQRSKLGIKRNSYHQNKDSWPSTAKRRKRG